MNDDVEQLQHDINNFLDEFILHDNILPLDKVAINQVKPKDFQHPEFKSQMLKDYNMGIAIQTNPIVGDLEHLFDNSSIQIEREIEVDLGHVIDNNVRLIIHRIFHYLVENNFTFEIQGHNGSYGSEIVLRLHDYKSNAHSEFRLPYPSCTDNLVVLKHSIWQLVKYFTAERMKNNGSGKRV